jgi:hypothetical protein
MYKRKTLIEFEHKNAIAKAFILLKYKPGYTESVHAQL